MHLHVQCTYKCTVFFLVPYMVRRRTIFGPEAKNMVRLDLKNGNMVRWDLEIIPEYPSVIALGQWGQRKSCNTTNKRKNLVERHAFRASSASSKSLPLSPHRPQKSATVIEKSLGKRVPNFCQSCVYLCVFVCILCNGGALRRTTRGEGG